MCRSACKASSVAARGHERGLLNTRTARCDLQAGNSEAQRGGLHTASHRVTESRSASPVRPAQSLGSPWSWGQVPGEAPLPHGTRQLLLTPELASLVDPVQGCTSSSRRHLLVLRHGPRSSRWPVPGGPSPCPAGLVPLARCPSCDSGHYFTLPHHLR